MTCDMQNMKIKLLNNWSDEFLCTSQLETHHLGLYNIELLKLWNI